MKFSYTLIQKFLRRAPSKQKLAEALNLHSFETENLGDDCLEVSIPPNRYSDASSHVGIAREASIIFDTEFKNPVSSIINQPSREGLINVEVKDEKLCPRYSARYFEIKSVGASPLWLQKVLKTCGIKPINDIVDCMNYVMLETGQPLHAFDFDKLAGSEKEKKIIVRKAEKGEQIETLDGQKLVLDSEMLVIADKEKALAIAGIKGGSNSGVGDGTRRIVIEAANFESVSIFKTSHKLKLNTDAAVRFSHGISPALIDWGLDRTTVLLEEAGARLVDSFDAYPKKASDEVIEFSEKKFEHLVGTKLASRDAQKIFKGLGFEINEPQELKDGFLVRVPAWRTDIETFEDLAEEASRFLGYNTLKASPPYVSIQPAHEEDMVILKDKIKNVLINLQLDEVYNYSFFSKEEAETSRRIFGIQNDPAALQNPISDDKEYLRNSLIPLLVKNVVSNSRFFDMIRIFEIGKIFRSIRGSLKETSVLGIALAAKREPRLILELKGIIDELLQSMGVPGFSMSEHREILRIEAGKATLGSLKLVQLEKGWFTAVAEIDIDAMLHLIEEEREFRPLPKYPSIMRDISLLLGRDTRIGEMLDAIQGASQELIENVDLVDEYADERFGGKQSVTFRIIFQSETRTLTDAEINVEMEKITRALRKQFKAEIR